MSYSRFPIWCRLFNEELGKLGLEPATTNAARFCYEEGDSPEEAAQMVLETLREENVALED